MFLQIFAISLGLLYILWFYFENFTRRKGRPPGPLRIPPFGNFIQVGLHGIDAHIGLHKLAKQYGDVMSIKLGLLETVVLSSFEATKQIFTKDECTGRHCSGIPYDRNFGQHDIGIAFSEGTANDKIRRYCRETLRIYGYGNREVMCNMLLNEITEFMKLIETEAKSNPERKIHCPASFFNRPFLNIVTTWVFGKRFSYDDREFQNLLNFAEDFARNGVVGAGIMFAYPFLRFIFPKALGYDMQMRGVRGVQDVSIRLLRERQKEIMNTHKQSCFTDNFIQSMEEEAQNPNPFFTEKQFAVVCSDLINAGADTTSLAVNFTLLLLVANERVQEKVFEEISSVIGNYRLPSIEDKLRMPYTQAVLLEGLRWARVAVLGVPRKATANFVYKDLHVKKGTILMCNTQSIMFDETTWGDPHVFRPERFLDLQGKIDPKKQEIVSLAFGIGKRICFGEVLGRDGLFVFITTLIQKFKFSLPSGFKPNLEPKVGMTLSPEDYEAIVTLREK